MLGRRVMIFLRKVEQFVVLWMLLLRRWMYLQSSMMSSDSLSQCCGLIFRLIFPSFPN